jgi:hypothetical protein
VVVVADVDEPTAIVVVLPATPAVPIFTALVVAVRVAPVARLRVDAAVVFPTVMVAPDAVSVPARVVGPLIVMAFVPVVVPMAILVVEPETPFVPMLIAFVVAVRVAPVPTLMVDAAVEFPSVWLALEKVMLPDTVWVLPKFIS